LLPKTLKNVLKERYNWSDVDARDFADFLLPMLDYNPGRRATAEQCLRHPWMRVLQQPATEQDSVQPSPEPLIPNNEIQASDTVVMETSC